MFEPSNINLKLNQPVNQSVVDLPIPPGASDELKRLIEVAQTGMRLVVDHLNEEKKLALIKLQSSELKFQNSKMRWKSELDLNWIVDTCINLLHQIMASVDSLESQLRAAGSDRLTLDDEAPLMNAANAIVNDMRAIIPNYLLRFALQ